MEGEAMTEPTCPCDEDPRGYWCPVHVDCDQNCRALEDPQTVDQVKAALDHWKNHHWLGGCSHAE